MPGLQYGRVSLKKTFLTILGANRHLFVALTGRRLPPYRGYNKKVDPSISLLFSTAAYRIGHSLVGPDIRRYGCGNTVLPSLKLKDVFFTAPKMMKRHAIEEFMRGMMLTKAQEVDPKATDLIRNFLFSSVKEEDVFDLIGVWHTIVNSKKY